MGAQEASGDLKFLDRQECECKVVKDILLHINETNINFTDFFRLEKYKSSTIVLELYLLHCLPFGTKENFK